MKKPFKLYTLTKKEIKNPIEKPDLNAKKPEKGFPNRKKLQKKIERRFFMSEEEANEFNVFSELLTYVFKISL